MEEAADIGGLMESGAGDAGARRAGSMRRPAWIDRCANLRVAAGNALKLGRLYLSQAQLILPGRQSQGAACARVTPPEHCELVHLSTPGGQVTALFGPACGPGENDVDQPLPDAASRLTLLFFYGNKMCLGISIHLFQHLRRLGVNVLVPDYLGFGLSSGAASEAACYATADAAYEHLLSRGDVDPSLIVAGGVSLGGAVAVDLAARRPLAGAMALVTFTSIPDMARHLYPDVPIWRLIRHKFDSAAKIGAVTCPTLVGHSTGDKLVPPWMADRLARRCGGPVTRLVIHGADHGAAEMLEVAGDALFAGMAQFLGTIQSGATPRAAGAASRV
jgi:hypothetical protein